MKTAVFNSHYHTDGMLQNILSHSLKLGMIQSAACRQLLISLKCQPAQWQYYTDVKTRVKKLLRAVHLNIFIIMLDLKGSTMNGSGACNIH